MPKDDMPLLGAHMSIRGGLHRALLRGREAGCRAVQIFTRNSRQWVASPLSSVEIDTFHRTREETSVEPVAVHNSYLINVASPDSGIREKSLVALLDEIKRTDLLKIPYLVIHPGSHRGDGEEEGLDRISKALDYVFARTPECNVNILLETTAGQGFSLGYRLEQLAEIIRRTAGRERLGICLDTCHIFAAGYDFSTLQSYGTLIAAIAATTGLKALKLVHMNDSKAEFGSRVDRHEHLGHGDIGKQGLSFFLNDPILAELPFVIETPKGKNDKGIDWDVVNLMSLRALIEEDTKNDCI